MHIDAIAIDMQALPSVAHLNHAYRRHCNWHAGIGSVTVSVRQLVGSMALAIAIGIGIDIGNVWPIAIVIGIVIDIVDIVDMSLPTCRCRQRHSDYV